MQAVNRRAWLRLAMAAVPACVLAQEPEPQVVKIVAQRFHYTPAQFTVKAGRPVVLEFSSIDFVHGFNLPAMKVRADLPPGRVTRVQFTPKEPGTYDFVCDNFCGDGHEEMHGSMVVEA